MRISHRLLQSPSQLYYLRSYLSNPPPAAIIRSTSFHKLGLVTTYRAPPCRTSEPAPLRASVKCNSPSLNSFNRVGDMTRAAGSDSRGDLDRAGPQCLFLAKGVAECASPPGLRPEASGRRGAFSLFK